MTLPLRTCELPGCGRTIARRHYGVAYYAKLRFCSMRCAAKARQLDRAPAAARYCKQCQSALPARSQNVYCSVECRIAAFRAQCQPPAVLQEPDKPCEHCGQPIPKFSPCGAPVSVRDYLARRYCCHKCASRARRGKTHPGKLLRGPHVICDPALHELWGPNGLAAQIRARRSEKSRQVVA